MAIATVGTFLFQIVQHRREQRQDDRTIEKLLDQALIEIDENPDRIEAPIECRPPTGADRMRLERAKEKIDDALSLNPEHPRSITCLGIYHMKLCEPSRAEELFRKAIERDIAKNYGKAHYCLGVILYQRRQANEALKEFEVAAKIDKEDPRPLVNMGMVQLNSGEYGKAVESFRQAKSRKEGSAEIWEFLGVAQYLKGEWTDAVFALREAVRLDDQRFLAHYHLGLAARRAGNHQEAVKRLEKAKTIDPELKQAYATLGDSLAQLGKKDEAERVLRECTARWDDYADCRDVLKGLD